MTLGVFIAHAVAIVACVGVAVLIVWDMWDS